MGKRKDRPQGWVPSLSEAQNSFLNDLSKVNFVVSKAEKFGHANHHTHKMWLNTSPLYKQSFADRKEALFSKLVELAVSNLYEDLTSADQKVRAEATRFVLKSGLGGAFNETTHNVKEERKTQVTSVRFQVDEAKPTLAIEANDSSAYPISRQDSPTEASQSAPQDISEQTS